MYGYVYKTTNLLNNKIYVGQHRRAVFDNFYYGSGVEISKALRKYGVNNFKCEILCECNSQSELDEQEIFWIATLNSTDRTIGYNIGRGGNCPNIEHHTDETKQKISEHNARYWKNKPLTLETRRKLSIAHTGKKLSKEHVQKIVEASKHRVYKRGYQNLKLRGRKISEETRQKLRESHLRHEPWNKNKTNVYSEETLQRIRDSTSKNNARYWSGKHRDDATKLKLSEAVKGRKFVNNGLVNRQVKIEELDTYLNDGWTLGCYQPNRRRKK